MVGMLLEVLCQLSVAHKTGEVRGIVRGIVLVIIMVLLLVQAGQAEGAR